MSRDAAPRERMPPSFGAPQFRHASRVQSELATGTEAPLYVFIRKLGRAPPPGRPLKIPWNALECGLQEGGTSALSLPGGLFSIQSPVLSQRRVDTQDASCPGPPLPSEAGSLKPVPSLQNTRVQRA